MLVLGVQAPAPAMPVATPAPSEFSLKVLHTNDTHAHIEQYDGSTSDCPDDEAAAGECIGGVARRTTAIAQAKAAAPDGNVILIDAGDAFQGTLFFTEYKGDEEAKFMNELGYQVMTVGNHEFDNGPAGLANFLDKVKFPVVSANIDASGEPLLDGKIAPYTVLDVNGEQVGIIGLTTVEAPTNSSPGPTLKFNDYVPALEPVLAELAGQGINKVILLSHIGYEADQQLAAEIDGVDLIVGGHSHTLLSNTDEAASGPYPTVVDSPSGSPVLITQAEAYGKYLGDINVTFDEAGVPVKWEGAPLLLDSTIAEDPAILAEVEELAIPVDKLRTEVIGETTTPLDGSRESCRFAECTMGNLVADAMLLAAKGYDPEVAIFNGGQVRASLEAGEISVGDVIEVLPFANNVATMGLAGADLRAALENGVSRAENPDNEGTGRFPQVANLRYSWDGSKPVGERIMSVEVKNPDGTFSPLDDTRVYEVVANTFMRTGGDGYQVLADKAIDPYDFGPTTAEAAANYIKAFTPVSATLEGRITRVDTPATPAATEAATPAATEAATPAAAATRSRYACGDGSSHACGNRSRHACGDRSGHACGDGSSHTCGDGSSHACGDRSSHACGDRSSHACGDGSSHARSHAGSYTCGSACRVTGQATGDWCGGVCLTAWVNRGRAARSRGCSRPRAAAREKIVGGDRAWGERA
ncbi:MAG: 5'-nucleotidase C-terminal domain-containing protein [Anaerolineales bacterium]|nr:5'-nucleotidase C-terminal domain-containing protein [Anaerolineales bacterium]